MIFNNKKGYMKAGHAFFFGLILGLLVALAIFLSAKGVVSLIPVCG